MMVTNMVTELWPGFQCPGLKTSWALGKASGLGCGPSHIGRLTQLYMVSLCSQDMSHLCLPARTVAISKHFIFSILPYVINIYDAMKLWIPCQNLHRIASVVAWKQLQFLETPGQFWGVGSLIGPWQFQSAIWKRSKVNNVTIVGGFGSSVSTMVQSTDSHSLDHALLY